MSNHSRKRRSPARWVSDDLKMMNRPSTILGTLREHPSILLEGLCVGIVACGLLALILMAFSNLDAFGDNVIYPVIAIGPFIGSRIHGYQNRPSSQD